MRRTLEKFDRLCANLQPVSANLHIQAGRTDLINSNGELESMLSAEQMRELVVHRNPFPRVFTNQRWRCCSYRVRAKGRVFWHTSLLARL